MSLPVRPLLGLDFTHATAGQAAAALAARPAAAPFGYVVTPNADHLVRLARQPDLAALYCGALMCLLDSRVVAGGARLLGLHPPAVAPGSDLVAEILARHLHPGERITVIGLAPRCLPALSARTGIAPPAHFDPPRGLADNPVALADCVAFARAHPARFTMLAVGAPQQERLAAAIAAEPGLHGVGLCIGAGLDFAAGAMPRAPVWMQGAGLEWLHRLVREPARLGPRYLRDDPAIFALLLRARLAAKVKTAR